MRNVRSTAVAFLTATLTMISALPAWSGSLQISTTTLEVAAPGMATSMQLRNTGSTPINVQIRAYEWSQAEGAEKLTDTDRLVASPPFATIAPGREFTVRVVRTSVRPDRPEDSFRLLVDELPAGKTNEGLGIRFTVRYSLPVFFSPASSRSAALAWKVAAARGEVRLTAINGGERRTRLAGLRIVDADGRTIAERSGLVGYVLGRSSMSWSLPATHAASLRPTAVLHASTDSGPINVPITLATSR